MAALFTFDVKDIPLLSGSQVQIVVTQYSTDSDGSILIGSQMSAADVDTSVQILKDELDLIAAKAKAIAQ